MAALSFVRAAAVSKIVRFALPNLRSNSILAFHVSGRYTFQYPKSWAGNDERRSGFHIVTILVRSCHGVMAVDPNWPGSGGLYAWQ
jgi:hypothetical protein